jgi:origin recognition complex subunit 1
LTASVDKNALESVDGAAYVFSEAAFNKKYPTGKVPRRTKEYGKTFICRRGVDPRRAQYTGEFVWEDLPHNNEEEMEQLIRRMEIETGCKQKRASAKRNKFDNDFMIDHTGKGYEEEGVSTPRKRQKTITHLTPRKPSTPSRLTPSHKRYGSFLQTIHC